MAAKPQHAKRGAERAGQRDRNAVSEWPNDKPAPVEWIACPACSKRAGKQVQHRQDWEVWRGDLG